MHKAQTACHNGTYSIAECSVLDYQQLYSDMQSVSNLNSVLQPNLKFIPTLPPHFSTEYSPQQRGYHNTLVPSRIITP